MLNDPAAGRPVLLEVCASDSGAPEWTAEWIASRWKPVLDVPDSGASVNFALDREGGEILYRWQKEASAESWLPEPSAYLVSPHDFGGRFGTKAFICLDLFNARGLLAEDARCLLETKHRRDSGVPQWKIVSFIESLVLVSTTAYALAMSSWSGREETFPLGSFLPRSIVSPFTGSEESGERHVFPDAKGRRHYASNLTTYSFLKDSEKMEPAERWRSGCFSAEYLRVAQKLPNRLMTAWKQDGESGSWFSVKEWRSVPNLYYATAEMERLVQSIRSGRSRLVPIDCLKLQEWYLKDYLRAKSGKFCRGKRINPRMAFPAVWRVWTGARSAESFGKPIEKFASFSKAMKKRSAEIASGSLVYVTRMEKILRGLFIGDDCGRSLAELAASRKPEKLYEAMKKRSPVKRERSGDEAISNAVYFDWQKLLSFFGKDPRAKKLTSVQMRQLERMADEGWINESGIGVYASTYRRSVHGRYYGSGNSLQMLPKWLRKELFGKYYVEADIGSAIVAIVASEAKAGGYSESLGELEEMLNDKTAYRQALAMEENGIGIEEVKRMTTMIGYGCRCNPELMASEAEWLWLVDTHGIDETAADAWTTRARTALFSGVEDPNEKMAIAEWASSEKVVRFREQLRAAGSFVIGRNTFRIGDSTVVRNAWGTDLVIPKGRRLSFGGKLAHIYQGAESKLLWTIWDRFEVGGRRLRDIEGGFGLFIHDGFGIRRDLAERLGDPAKALRDFAKRELGLNVTYSCA